MKTRLIGAALAAFLLAAPASASVVWRGDFETGDLSQWSSKQAVSSDRLQIVDSPVTQGRHALRVMVKQGDDPIDASGNRNELVYTSYEPSGTERWYRWQTMWPLDYPSASKWQLFTQWHHSGSTGSPPIEFAVQGENMGFNVQSQTVWHTPLVRGVWHDFILHVKWSPNASEGFVECYYDGELVLPRTSVATQFAGQTQYLKQGLYRDESITQDAVVYHDGMIIGTSFEDVATALPDGGTAEPGPDSGTVEPDSGTVVPEPDAGEVGESPDGSPEDGSGSPQIPGDGVDELAQVGCSSVGGVSGAALFAVVLAFAGIVTGIRRRK